MSPASVSQTGTLTLSATPQAGTDYIYTTAYYAKGSTWLPVTLTGNNAAPSYSSGPAQGSLSSSILQTLTLGTNYVVLWDWLWDATAQCYKGPGLNQCNTGIWRVQTFNLTPGSASCLTSTAAFQSQAIPSQTGSFRITFDATPSLNGMNGDIGLSANAAIAYTDMAAIVEFNNGGNITARNGAAYQALSAIPYTAGSVYHFRLDINIPTHTYSAYVTPPGQAEQIIGVNYAFRTEQAAATSLTYLNLVDVTGTETLCNSAVSPIGGYTYSQSAYGIYTYSQSAYTSGCTSGCNNYYVSPVGNDSNPGTQASPWLTLTHADAAFTLGANGTIIHVANGTYSGVRTLNRGGSSTTVRLVLQCDNGIADAFTAKGKCMVTGTPGVGFAVDGANNIDIVGFDIGNNADMGTAVVGVYEGSAVQSTSANSVHVIGNYIHDLGANGGAGTPQNGGPCPQAGAILIQNQHGHYVTDTQVLRNVVLRFGPHTQSTFCQHAQGIYITAHGAIIENNISGENTSTGIDDFDDSCSQRISNNISFNNNGWGIIENGHTDGCALGLNTTNNNILVNNGNRGQIGEAGNGGGLFVGNLGNCTPSTPSLYSNNIISGNQIAIQGTQSCDRVQNTINEAPSTTFVNYQPDGTGNYQIKAGSKAVNGGTSQCVSGGMSPCTPSTDFDGRPRPQGSAIDIGAYEQ